MEIRRWHCYVVINCALLIPFLSAKTFNLNEAIAAESRQKQELETTLRPIEKPVDRFSLNKALNLNRLKIKKLKTSDYLLPLSSKISPSKFRKKYQIKTPLKPKKLKYKQKRLKKSNQSIKREIGRNGKINRKYIPLIRNIGKLFDNFIPPESSDSSEIDRRLPEKRSDVVCACSRKSDSEIAESRPPEKAVTSATSPEFSTIKTVSIQTTTPTPNHASTSDISNHGQDSNVPLLLSRNTTSARGNNNGFSEGSSSTFHSSIERDITRDNRNSKYNTRSEQNETSSTNHEKDPYSSTRVSTSSDEFRRIHGEENDTRAPIYRRPIDKIQEYSKDQNGIRYIRGSVNEHKGENNFQIGGDKTESPLYLPKLSGEFRGDVSQDKIRNSTEFVESKEDREQSIINISHDNTSDQRVTVGNGEFAAENKKTRATNEAVITIKDLSNPILLLQKNPKNKAPMVTIIDGYSVARDKTGTHKVAEKSVHVHS